MSLVERARVAAEMVAKLRSDVLSQPTPNRVLMLAELAWTEPDAFWVAVGETTNLGMARVTDTTGLMDGLPFALVSTIDRLGMRVAIGQLREQLLREGKMSIFPSTEPAGLDL